ncbi:MAG TPA: IPT/TIG domain-containing protein [Thermoanaerobaculia bacterium]|nr:IPT/TIG domain-containing protein [Thermoanaerobaculia bacterium]
MKRLLLISALFAASFTAAAAPTVTGLSPSTGPTSGGTLVEIRGHDLLPDAVCIGPCPTTVTFGDTTVDVTEATETRLTVITPAHAPGTVDVIVSILNAAPVRLSNAFTFTGDPEAAYEQVLLPLYVEGVAPGVGGSQWKTDFWMRNNGQYDDRDPEVRVAPWPCQDTLACPAVVPPSYFVKQGELLHNLPPLTQRAPGNPSRLLFVSRNGSENMSFSLRFADVSRAALNGGTDLPVIRESEFLRGTAHLLNVPMTSNYRVQLRVYHLYRTSDVYTIRIYEHKEGVEQGALLHTDRVSTPLTDMGEFRSQAGYAQFDVTSLLQLDHVAWPETVRIEIQGDGRNGRFWTFASVTNNDTQMVTLVTPQ